MNCENCQQEHDGLYGSGRFCSTKCARGFSTKANRKEISEKVSKKLKGRNIGNYNFTHEQQAKGRATRDKNSKIRITQLVESWLRNEINFTDKQVRYSYRILIFEAHGNKCEKCGYNKRHPNTENVGLTIHHIDGDHTNGYFSNIEVICYNCHWLTPNFTRRGKNGKLKGNRGSKVMVTKRSPKA